MTSHGTPQTCAYAVPGARAEHSERERNHALGGRAAFCPIADFRAPSGTGRHVRTRGPDDGRSSSQTVRRSHPRARSRPTGNSSSVKWPVFYRSCRLSAFGGRRIPAPRATPHHSRTIRLPESPAPRTAPMRVNGPAGPLNSPRPGKGKRREPCDCPALPAVRADSPDAYASPYAAGRHSGPDLARRTGNGAPGLSSPWDAVVGPDGGSVLRLPRRALAPWRSGRPPA
jgi:hypothetical protein